MCFVLRVVSLHDISKLYCVKGKVQKKKIEEKKLTSVSFMYVCVAENGEMLVIFSFFCPNNSLTDNSLSE